MSDKKTLTKQVLEILKKENDFLVVTHVQPDGDAVGSLLAVGRLLEELGKKRTLAIVDGNDIPPQYRWLPGIEGLQTGNREVGSRVMITLDAANKDRLGPFTAALDNHSLTVNIDHHPDNSAFAVVNWTDVEVSSTAEMIYDLWMDLGWPMDERTALCVYVGMLTDTGRWQYSNTNERTLMKAAALLRAGVKPIEVFRRVYENYSVEWFKLLSLGLQKAVFNRELGLAHAVITQNDLKVTGASMAETENLVDWLRAVGGISVAMVLKETRQGDIKVSLRSQDPVDVGLMAGHFGGGGHKNASGFVAKSGPDEIVDNVKKWLTEFS